MLSVYTGFDGAYYHHSGGPGVGLGPWASIIHGAPPYQHSTTVLVEAVTHYLHELNKELHSIDYFVTLDKYL